MARAKRERTNDYYKTLPCNLRYLMEKTRTTQDELGKAIGKSRQSVSYYCDGSVAPDWETLVLIAKYFHVSSDYLLGLSEEPTVKEDLKIAIKTTGLTGSAIANIQPLSDGTSCSSPSYSFALNSILEYPEFLSVVLELEFALRRSSSIVKSYQDDASSDPLASNLDINQIHASARRHGMHVLNRLDTAKWQADRVKQEAARFFNELTEKLIVDPVRKKELETIEEDQNAVE